MDLPATMPGALSQVPFHFAVSSQPPAKSVGQTVRGAIYVDTVNAADVWATGDEVTALEEHYTPRLPTFF